MCTVVDKRGERKVSTKHIREVPEYVVGILGSTDKITMRAEPLPGEWFRPRRQGDGFGTFMQAGEGLLMI